MMPNGNQLADEDAEHILKLLNEYSEKLRERTAEASQWRFISDIVVIISGTLIAATLGLVFWLGSAWALGSRVSTASIIVAIISIAGGLMWRAMRIQIRADNDGILALLVGLGRLVRRGSQMEDHGAVNFTKRIALDLRLAEAEATLKQAASTISHRDVTRLKGLIDDYVNADVSR